MEDMGTREEYLEVEEKGESGVVAEWGRGLVRSWMVLKHSRYLFTTKNNPKMPCGKQHSHNSNSN